MSKLIKHLRGIPTGSPSVAWGDKYRWGQKIRDFRPLSRYIFQTIQDITIVTIEGE